MCPSSDAMQGDSGIEVTEALVREVATNLRVHEKMIDVLVEKMFGPPPEHGPYGERVWSVWNRDVLVILVAKQVSHLWEGLE